MLISFMIMLFYLYPSHPRAEEMPRKKVLVLFSFRPTLPVAAQWDRGIRSVFKADKDLEIVTNIEYLDRSSYGDIDHLNILLDLYRHKYSNPKPDLIIPVLNESFDLILNYGSDLFPDVPVVFGGIEQQHIAHRALPANFTGYFTDNDYAGTLDLVLDLHPDTRNVVVVAGAGPIMLGWSSHCRSTYQVYEDRINFTYLLGLTMNDLLDQLGQLPPYTIVISLPVLIDGVGNEFVGNESFKKITAASIAPVYTFWDIALGTGVVGGYMSSFEKEGEVVAQLGLRLLKGENPGNIPIERAPKYAYMFDYRQLKRWGVEEDGLPSGSIVNFREPGLWEKYEIYIIGVLTIFVLQIMLIFYLLYRRKVRVRAQLNVIEKLAFEQLLSEMSSDFTHLRASQTDSKILEGLARIGNFLDADRAFLFRFNWDRTEYFISHLWESEGTEDDQIVRGSIVKELFPWLYENLIHSRDIVVPESEELNAPATLPEYNYCKQIGIQSFLVLPIDLADAPLCAIGLDAIRSTKKWSTEIKDRLRLIGEIFANAIERQHSEVRVRETERKYRTVADYTFDWEYWQNPDNSLQWVSPSCEQVCGYSAEDIQKNPDLLTDIIVPEDRDAWDKHRCTTQEQVKPGAIQFRIKRPDGEIRWIDHICQPVVDQQGNNLGVRASNRDVSLRESYKAETRELQAELAHMERIVTVNTMSAALAHEINQPLAAMRSYAQAALRFMDANQPEYDNIRKALQGIVADNKRAAAVVNRLRDLVKHETGHWEMLEINSIIKEVKSFINSEIVLRNVTITLDLYPVAPFFHGDPIQIQQVLINLLTNALDAMEDQPIERRSIIITTRPENSNGIIVSILDSGEGISHDKIDEIFAPFHTTKLKGLGLGLAICKSIIEAHGGKIWAENNAGGGAKFSFNLPPAGN